MTNYTLTTGAVSASARRRSALALGWLAAAALLAGGCHEAAAPEESTATPSSAPDVEATPTTVHTRRAELTAAAGFTAAAEQKTVTFDNEESLLKMTFETFTDNNSPYQEEWMKFLDGVHPVDPQLGFGGCSDYFVDFLNEFPEQGRTLGPQPFSSHDCVIQMTYEPSGLWDPSDATHREPFNLISIQVLQGRLNVGTKSRTGELSVWYLDGPGVWTFPGATDLVRATLELPPEAEGAPFWVDNIVFEPTPPTPNRRPTAEAGGPYSGTEGAGIQLSSAGSSDPDGDVLGYRWDFGDGTTSTAANPKKVYADNRKYFVRLDVSDPAGLVASDYTEVTVANAAPVVKFAATGATTFRAGGTLSVQGSFTDRGVKDTPWTYTIAWGDGTASTTGTLSSQGTAIAASHRYTTAGTRSAYMTVKDKDGAVGTSAKLTVTVSR